jgi:hypothetical protein
MGVGKISLLLSYADGDYMPSTATIGMDFKFVRLESDLRVTLRLQIVRMTCP